MLLKSSKKLASKNTTNVDVDKIFPKNITKLLMLLQSSKKLACKNTTKLLISILRK